MNTTKVEELLREAADELRKYVSAQVEAWQQIPHWALESSGRTGWSDGASIPYQYGLLGLDTNWPHRVFVDLGSGCMVSSTGDELIDATDKDILDAFLSAPSNFEAAQIMSTMIERATNGNDLYNKVENDAMREELRERYNVPRIWTNTAKPIRYSYQY
jgi:hypothetical protein